MQTAVSDLCTPKASDPTETTASNQGVVAGPPFSQEQQRRFQVRYEEGFGVAGDPDYVSWLRINHPDSPLLRHPTGPQTSASTTFQMSLLLQRLTLPLLTQI